MEATTLPVTLASEEGHPIQALALADQLANTLAATLKPIAIGDTVHMPVPDGYSLHDLTKARDQRAQVDHRKRGTAILLDLQSFVTYCKDQQQSANGYVYADTNARSFTAVFNDYRDIIVAGWRDHRAHYAAEFTPEFRRWLEHNGNAKAKGQTEFAEFIEDNFADLVAPFAQQLLDVATTIQAKTDINFSSAKRLHDGQVQLGYTEVIDAKAGADGALTIPREFELGLRIFKNGDGYKLKARLKYRLGNGGVKFWYELDRPERAIEDAFTGYIEKVRTESGYSVLIGRPDKAAYLAGIGQQLNEPTIEEIAHALAQINRFTGHAMRPYSVAEHSLLVSSIAASEGATPVQQLGALLHDAHEAYVGDVSSPAKWAIGQPWETFEHYQEHSVHNALGVRSTMSAHRARIKRWDLIALATERRDLLKWDAATSAPWRVLDTPGQEVQPVELDLKAQARAEMRWTDWREVFIDHHQQLVQKVRACQ